MVVSVQGCKASSDRTAQLLPNGFGRVRSMFQSSEPVSEGWKAGSHSDLTSDYEGNKGKDDTKWTHFKAMRDSLQNYSKIQQVFQKSPDQLYMHQIKLPERIQATLEQQPVGRPRFGADPGENAVTVGIPEHSGKTLAFP
jgi:hypothetical protein